MMNLKWNPCIFILVFGFGHCTFAQETVGDGVWKQMQEEYKNGMDAENQRLFHDLSNDENARRESASISVKNGFYKEFIKAQELIVAGKLEMAQKPLAKLHKIEKLTDYETPRLWLLDYWYAGKAGDKQKENEALMQVVATGARQIDSDVFIDAGIRLFTRQYNAKDYGRALDTLGFLKQDSQSMSALDGISTAVNKVEEITSGARDISVVIKADEAGSWSTKLLRPTFYLTNINGNVNTLDLDCENKKTSVAYQNDSVMAIPAGWGSCAVKINSSPNTTYNFVQMLNKPA